MVNREMLDKLKKAKDRRGNKINFNQPGELIDGRPQNNLVFLRGTFTAAELADIASCMKFLEKSKPTKKKMEIDGPSLFVGSPIVWPENYHMVGNFKNGKL